MKSAAAKNPEKQGSGKAKSANAGGPEQERGVERISIHVDRSGDWMPAEELRAAALEALSQDRDVELNLGKVDHLDASALQILLALDREQKQRGHRLEVEQVSAHMREWFAYAGAAEELRLPVEANEQ